MSLAATRSFVRTFIDKWGDDQVGTHGAALAYYALFSIAPLLVVTIAVLGLVLGERAATSEVVARFEETVGPEPARMVRQMIAQVASPRSGLIATALGLLTMLIGATGVLARLQGTLRRIWGVDPRRGVGGSLLARLIGVGLIVGLGGLLFASMLLSAALNALQERLATEFPTAAALAGPVNVGVAIAFNALVIAALFRTLPSVRTPWRDLAVGGLFTATLFALGTEGIGWYLGRASTSVYGAASSLVLLMLWIYYSAQILLAGAVFTVLWSRRRSDALRADASSG